MSKLSTFRSVKAVSASFTNGVTIGAAPTTATYNQGTAYGAPGLSFNDPSEGTMSIYSSSWFNTAGKNALLELTSGNTFSVNMRLADSTTGDATITLTSNWVSSGSDYTATFTASPAVFSFYPWSISITTGGSYTLPSSTSGAASGDVLTFTNAGLQWNPPAGGSISSLTGVNIAAPQAGQVLKFDGSYWINDTDATSSGGGITSLNDLIQGNATGQRLVWDNEQGTWNVAAPLILNDLLSPSDPMAYNQVIKWSSINWSWEAGSLTLNDFITGTYNGQVIKWNQDLGVWEAGADNTSQPFVFSQTTELVNGSETASNIISSPIGFQEESKIKFRANGEIVLSPSNGNHVSINGGISLTTGPDATLIGGIIPWTSTPYSGPALGISYGTMLSLADTYDRQIKITGSGIDLSGTDGWIVVQPNVKLKPAQNEDGIGFYVNDEQRIALTYNGITFPDGTVMASSPQSWGIGFSTNDDTRSSYIGAKWGGGIGFADGVINLIPSDGPTGRGVVHAPAISVDFGGGVDSFYGNIETVNAGRIIMTEPSGGSPTSGGGITFADGTFQGTSAISPAPTYYDYTQLGYSYTVTQNTTEWTLVPDGFSWDITFVKDGYVKFTFTPSDIYWNQQGSGNIGVGIRVDAIIPPVGPRGDMTVFHTMPSAVSIMSPPVTAVFLINKDTVFNIKPIYFAQSISGGCSFNLTGNSTHCSFIMEYM